MGLCGLCVWFLSQTTSANRPFVWHNYCNICVTYQGVTHISGVRQVFQFGLQKDQVVGPHDSTLWGFLHTLCIWTIILKLPTALLSLRKIFPWISLWGIAVLFVPMPNLWLQLSGHMLDKIFWEGRDLSKYFLYNIFDYLQMARRLSLMM